MQFEVISIDRENGFSGRMVRFQSVCVWRNRYTHSLTEAQCCDTTVLYSRNKNHNYSSVVCFTTGESVVVGVAR